MSAAGLGADGFNAWLAELPVSDCCRRGFKFDCRRVGESRNEVSWRAPKKEF
jgi:hypothetical protein